MNVPDLPAGPVARALVDGTPHGVVAVDRERRVTLWNAALARLTGLAAAAAIGRDVLDLLPWLRGADAEPRLRAALAGTRSLVRGLRHRPAGAGRGRVYDVRYLPLPAADGAVIGALALLHESGAGGRRGGRARAGPADARGDAVEQRRRAEAALREREARLRAVVDNLPGVVWRRVRHPDGRIGFPYYSPNAERVHGYSAAAVQRDPGLLLRMIHPGDRAGWHAAVEASAAELTRFACDFRVITAQGGRRWFRALAAPRREADGAVVWDGVTLDVTGLKEAEAALRAAKDEAERNSRLLQTTLENVAEAIALYDADGRLVLCNDTYRGLFHESADMLKPGVAFEDLIRIRAEQGLAPDVPAGRVEEWVRERMARFWNPAGPVERPFPDGSWWRFSERRSRDGGVAQVGIDITALKRREAELRAGERRFRDFAESASDWLWETDALGRLTYLSERFEEVTGLDPRRLLGTRPGDELGRGRPDGAAARRRLRAELAARRPFRGFVHRHRLPDGRVLVWQINGRPVFDEGGAFRGYRGSATDITERVAAEERVRHLARHDALTGLPNRALFADRLDQALAAARREEGEVAVLCVDLNDFKGINDTLGHAAGDELLRQVAARLRATVREADTVARLGGDEFAVIQPAAGGFGAAAALARRVLVRLAKPYVVEGHELHSGASVGIAVFPDDGHDRSELMRNADLALYRAKAEGGDTFQFFLPEMNEALQRRRRVEQDLRRAVEEGRLALHFQPQVEIATGRIVGVEALLRWPHPERGLIPPGLFVPVAEDCGLILPLGRWVLRSACRQARAWRDAGLPEVRVAVNLSPVQFAQGDVVEEVTQALRESGLPPGALELEITEGSLMRDTEAAVDTLRRLHALGVVLALDDFGTGYSSLNYLRRFPLDRVKIDRCFVRDVADDPGDAVIANAIVTLGHALGLKVIAEGVETPRQLAQLRRQGCDEAQGYYFAPPLPAEACAELLADPARPAAWAAAGTGARAEAAVAN